jgi:alpha-D-ribose 1-methylphosphonate 5-triphosphate synthase subunit PhnH
MKKIHEFDELHDTQKLFRCILTAISNPGKTINIAAFAAKMYGRSPALLAVAITLLDNEVTFNADNIALADEIITLTLAKPAPSGHADFIFVTDALRLREAIESAKYGTLRDPHQSGTIIAAIDDSEDTSLRLSGPGIDGITELHTSHAVCAAMELRDAQYYEYPQGIDLIFISDGGRLTVIPRLTRREV